jgi:hypothetical protein
MAKTGADAGILLVSELQEKIEKSLEPFNFPKPAVARIANSDLYFAPGVYDRMKDVGDALQAVSDAALSQPGVAAVYWAEEVQGRPATQNPIRSAIANSYFQGRSGDLFIIPRPYWLVDGTPAGKMRTYGTGHGTPYNYDQHVPILLMGYGIQPGDYYREVTPADIAPTLATLCGITLVPRDGHILAGSASKTHCASKASNPAISITTIDPM